MLLDHPSECNRRQAWLCKSALLEACLLLPGVVHGSADSILRVPQRQVAMLSACAAMLGGLVQRLGHAADRQYTTHHAKCLKLTHTGGQVIRISWQQFLPNTPALRLLGNPIWLFSDSSLTQNTIVGVIISDYSRAISLADEGSLTDPCHKVLLLLHTRSILLQD